MLEGDWQMTQKIFLKQLPGYPVGLYALVDDEDYERLSAYRWSPKRGRRGDFYAQRTFYNADLEKVVTREMQREVLDPEFSAVRSQLSDHINHDTLDNTRNNLRWKDYRGSVLNRRKYTNNTSGFRGVSKISAGWRACIMSYGRRYIENHYTLRDAALAYNRMAVLHHGSDAVLNDVSALNDPPTLSPPLHSNNTSGYRGVSVYNGGNRFSVSISINGQKTQLWGFTAAIEAAQAYNELAIKHHGALAKLNVLPVVDSQ